MPKGRYNDLAAEVRRLKLQLQGKTSLPATGGPNELQWRDDVNRAALRRHLRYVQVLGLDSPPHYAGSGLAAMRAAGHISARCYARDRRLLRSACLGRHQWSPPSADGATSAMEPTGAYDTAEGSAAIGLPLHTLPPNRFARAAGPSRAGVDSGDTLHELRKMPSAVSFPY